MLSFSLVAEALTGLIYHRPSGENSKFAHFACFDSKHFDEVNQFIEDNYEYFYPPEDPDDYRSDMDDDHDLVADVDSDTLIKLVKLLNPISTGGGGGGGCFPPHT